MLGDILGALLGAAVGGTFALLGSWLVIRWQAKQEARAIALGILAELTVGREIDPENSAEVFHRRVISQAMATGQVPDAKLLVASLDHDPAQALPVYYGNVASVGILPPNLARQIIVYYARTQALRLLAVRGFGGQMELKPEQMKAIARSLEALHDTWQKNQRELISALRKYAGETE